MAQAKDEYAWSEIIDALREAGFTPGERKRYDAAEGEESAGTEGDPKSGIFRILIILIGACLAAGLLFFAGLIWWANARQYEATDDAFIDTHIVYVSPQIPGLVSAVYVNDNQAVRKGELLAEIDSADAQAKFAQIQAAKAQAESQYQSALDTERGTVAQAESAERELSRYRLLQRTLPSAVSQQQIDQVTATESNAAAQRDSAEQQVSAAMAQIDNYGAQLNAAQLNLGYARIVAPVDGHIAQRVVTAGDYVSLGQQMLAIVPLQLWVTANFKETQVSNIRIGQKVTMTVDACGTEVLTGHVESIQRGSGQAFQILPPENASGNYVKVVQRVPVKIALDRVPPDCPLGPGISVAPQVKVR